MKLKHSKARSLAATLITTGLLAGGANAAIVIHGDPNGTTGVLEITQDITFTVAQNAGDTFLEFNLKNWVSSNDGVEDFVNLTNITISVSHNGTPLNNGNNATLVSDNGGALGSSIPTDGWLGLWSFLPVASGFLTLNLGDTITIHTGTADFNTHVGASFNSQLANGYTFNGEIELLDISSPRQIMATTTIAVPEPSSALLVGLGALGGVTRRRRT